MDSLSSGCIQFNLVSSADHQTDLLGQFGGPYVIHYFNRQVLSNLIFGGSSNFWGGIMDHPPKKPSTCKNIMRCWASNHREAKKSAQAIRVPKGNPPGESKGSEPRALWKARHFNGWGRCEKSWEKNITPKENKMAMENHFKSEIHLEMVGCPLSC